MTAEWTEGVCDDGAAILRDGQPVPITELLEHLNKCESIRSAALEEAATVAEYHQAEYEAGGPDGSDIAAARIASAIRALKDKPHE